MKFDTLDNFNDQVNILYNTRAELGKQLHLFFDGKIQDNIFKGCLLPEFSEWTGTQDLGPKLLGTYEQEILNFLKTSKGSYSFLIDVGAADGYYVVGSLFAKIVDRSYGFEINEKSRNIMLQNAKINNVIDSTHVDSEATLEKIYNILKKEKENTGIFIIDIEGAEFDLLTNNFLEMCQDHTLIIEIHSWNDNNNKYKDLIECSNNFFNVNYFYNRTKTLPNLPFINNINDNIKWLLCSEGRWQQQEWLLLTPKNRAGVN